MLDGATFDYYARMGAALFPIPAGKKAPHGIVESFKDNHSTDPEQWKKWQSENPGCNFGLVAYASGLIICDIDVKPTADQSAEDASTEAWEAWGNLCKSWGLTEPLAPYCASPHGGWHVLCAVPPHVDAATLRQPDAIKGRINVRVKGYTVAAGSYYDGSEKNDAPGHYQLFGDAPPHPAPLGLIEHCSPKTCETVTRVGVHDFNDTKKLYQWMADNRVILSDEDWYTAGMAARLEFGDRGLELWQILATRSNGVLSSESMARWNSFDTQPTPGRRVVAMGSIFDIAHAAGWNGSVGSSVAAMFPHEVVAAAMSGNIEPAQPIDLPPDTPGPSNPIDEENAADELAFPTPAGGFIKAESEFTDGFIPPDYLLDSVLQLRFCYAMTAQTGVGKTTVAMRLAAHVATEQQFCGLDVQKGTVIYFAGENPTDVQMRWIGLKRDMRLTGPVDVHFVSGALHISKVIARITREIKEKGLKPSLIVVDTSAAFFEGQDDNSNVEQGEHARRLRALTLLPGGPCVLILAHPTKGAKTIDEMTPRGGGAFLNEVDGNIGLARVDGGPIVAQAVGKFRGPEFTPLNFKLKVIRDHPLLKDTKGRSIPTVIAEPISEAEIIRSKGDMRKREDQILKLLCDHPGQGTVEIAKTLGWSGHSTASKLLKGLAEQKLVNNERDLWETTPKGQKALNLAEKAAAAPVQALPVLAPAVLGDAAFPTPQRPGSPPPMPPVPC